MFSGLGKPHPIRDKHGTLYHFHITSLMVPMISLGATLATLVSKVIPDLYIVIIYGVILTAVFLYNLKRLVAIIKRETSPKIEVEEAYAIDDGKPTTEEKQAKFAKEKQNKEGADDEFFEGKPDEPSSHPTIVKKEDNPTEGNEPNKPFDARVTFTP